MPTDSAYLRDLDTRLQQRYGDRYHKFHRDPRTLGWDTTTNQQVRFSRATDNVAFQGRSVLDIGCGLADFHDFLAARPETTPARYTGFDVVPEFVADCAKRLPGASFEQRNILIDPPQGRWDIVTMFGLLNLKLEIDNRNFARQLITQAFALCRDALVVDMLSAARDPAYPAEDFVFYYDPGEMLNFALTLSPHVSLRHDGPSIPQREFTLILRRQPCRS